MIPSKKPMVATPDQAMSLAVNSGLGFQLFQHLPASVAVIDPDFQVVLANQRFAQTFGARVGQRCYEIYKKRDSVCESCQAVETFHDGQVRVKEEQGLDRNGRPTYYVVHMAPLYDDVGNVAYVVEMSLDVTETHDLSRQLLRESAFRHNLTENVPDALVATDEQGVLRLFNPAAEGLFGRSAAEILNTPEAGRIYPEPFLAALAAGESAPLIVETEIVRQDGNRIPVRLSGRTLTDQHGIVIGGAAIFQDLRQIRHREQQKLERERLAAVGRTVAEMAHAIKNILTGLQGGIHKLRAGQRQRAPEKIDKGWEMVDRNFERIRSLVKGLLSLSRERATGLETVNLCAVAEEVCAQFRELATEKSVVLRGDFSAEAISVTGDAEDLHTCLSNLVSNAIDACEGSALPECSVTVRCARRSEEALVEVRDTGCGMDDQVLRRIFDVFYSTKGPRGTGLGLAVSRKVIEERGGTLEASSEPGSGSVFRIVMPFVQPAATLDPPEETTRPAGLQPEKKHPARSAAEPAQGISSAHDRRRQNDA